MTDTEFKQARELCEKRNGDHEWAARTIIFEEHCATSDERPFRALMAYDNLMMLAAKVPALLAEVERLRGELSIRTPSQVAELTAELEAVRRERDEARAANATLHRGYRDLHAMLPGSKDVWSKVADLRSLLREALDLASGTHDAGLDGQEFHDRIAAIRKEAFGE